MVGYPQTWDLPPPPCYWHLVVITGYLLKLIHYHFWGIFVGWYHTVLKIARFRLHLQQMKDKVNQWRVWKPWICAYHVWIPYSFLNLRVMYVQIYCQLFFFFVMATTMNIGSQWWLRVVMNFHNLQHKKTTFCWLAIVIAVVQTITGVKRYMVNTN